MIYRNPTAEPREELNDFVAEGMTDVTQFKALKLFPEYPAGLLTVHYPKITIANGDLMRAANKVRAPGSDFARFQAAIDDGTATLLQISEETSIPDEQGRLYEDYFDIEAFYSNECSDRQRRGIEVDTANVAFNSLNFDAVNGGVAYTTGNLATMTPVNDLLVAIRRLKARGEAPNQIVYSGPIYDIVRQSADMRSFIAGSINPGARVDEKNIQAAFSANGIEEVVVCESYVNQSDTGSNSVINPIFPNTYVFVGKAKTGALRAGGYGRTMYWEKDGPLQAIFTYRDEPRASNVIRSKRTSAPIITNARAGTLIGTQTT